MSRAQDLTEIVIAAHALTRIVALETKNDTPAAQWRTLSVLSNDGPQRLGTLATATRITQPGMTRLVGQLAEAGLVVREHDPDDSRATVVCITQDGTDSLALWRTELRDALEPMFADLGDDDWEALSRVARILSTRTTPLGANR